VALIDAIDTGFSIWGRRAPLRVCGRDESDILPHGRAFH
jgi:hypothetical protein